MRAVQRCSVSELQRKPAIGYNRAAKLVERLELEGVVGTVQSGVVKPPGKGVWVRDWRS
ncbi:MAG: Ftsk gamma domain [Myxococcaceae bacterium]|nr:Ftsk gamma domain [Myxococcaceae bacterium]